MREDGLCPCNQTVYESPETGYDIITCFINENVDPSVTEFRIKGINEFAKYNDSVLGIELSSILEHPGMNSSRPTFVLVTLTLFLFTNLESFKVLFTLHLELSTLGLTRDFTPWADIACLTSFVFKELPAREG